MARGDKASYAKYVFPVLFLAGVVIFIYIRFISPNSSMRSGDHIVAVGLNQNGQLARKDHALKLATLTDLSVPLPGADDGDSIKKVKNGSYSTIILARSGRVYGYGSNTHNEVSEQPNQFFDEPQQMFFEGLLPEETIVDIDISRDHGLALTNQGRVYAWGSNYSGQIGNGTNDQQGKPVLVAGIPKSVAIAAGYRHSAVVAESGEVYGWGGSCSKEEFSRFVRLLHRGAISSALGGYGTTVQSSQHTDAVEDCANQENTFVQNKLPQKLNGIDGKKAKSISVGYGHILVLTEDDLLYSGGCNSYGQLGRDKPGSASVPSRNDLYQVELSQPAKIISAGYRHSSVIKEDGSLWLWGYNGTAKTLGLEKHEQAVNRPAKYGTDYTVQLVELGHDTVFALTSEGTIEGWGQDDIEAFWPKHASGRTTLGRVGTEGHMQISAGIAHLSVLGEKE